MLDEVRDTGFALRSNFIPCARIDDQTAVRNGAIYMFVDDPKSVFELRSMELFFPPVGQGAFKHVGHRGG